MNKKVPRMNLSLSLSSNTLEFAIKSAQLSAGGLGRQVLPSYLII